MCLTYLIETPWERDQQLEGWLQPAEASLSWLLPVVLWAWEAGDTSGTTSASLNITVLTPSAPQGQTDWSELSTWW